MCNNPLPLLIFGYSERIQDLNTSILMSSCNRFKRNPPCLTGKNLSTQGTEFRQSTKQNIFNVKAESEGTFIKHSPCFLSVLLSRCQAVQSSQNSPTLPQVLHVASLFDDLARPGTDGTDVAARLPMLDAK